MFEISTSKETASSDPKKDNKAVVDLEALESAVSSEGKESEVCANLIFAVFTFLTCKFGLLKEWESWD